MVICNACVANPKSIISQYTLPLQTQSHLPLKIKINYLGKLKL